MPNLNTIQFDYAFPPVTPWLVVGVIIALAGCSFVRRRKLLVRLPGPGAGKWVTGHFRKITGVDGIAFQENVISTYGPTVKMDGAFGEEFIFTVDPAIMHTVLVKDKAKFERAHGVTLIIRSVFGGGLLGLTGSEHRIHRKLLNPVFTMKFLRELTPIFINIAKQTSLGIKKELNALKDSSKEIDVFPWATVAALELIGEAGLGYSFNSFTGERNEYNTAIKSVMQVISKMAPYYKLLPYIYHLGTSSIRRWALQHFPSGMIQRLRYAVKVQNEQAEEVLRNRQALISSGVDLSSEAGRGRDIMTLLMKANEAEGSEFHIDRRGMVGHMNVFVFAGHETTSTAVSRILDVLASQPRIQVKLRDEIRQYFEANPDEIHHDGLLELPYLDGVVREALRLYGPVPFLSRVCEEDTILPLEYPIDTPSGKITSVPVKKGTRVLMSIVVANRYARIWGERAQEFSPERWIGSKLDEVTQPGAHLPGIYSSMMTFGAGSRACIGFKFAVMEIKVMIAELVKDFKFESPQKNYVWEATGIQFPYLKEDLPKPSKLPRLPLRVIEL